MDAHEHGENTSDDGGLTRRRLLRLGLLAAGAGAVAVPAGTFGGYTSAAAESVTHRLTNRTGLPSISYGPSAAFDPSAPASEIPTAHASLGGAPAEAAVQPSHTAPHTTPPSSPATTHPASTTHPSSAGRPTWLSTWSHPVYALDDFTKRSRGTHFPRNAIMLTIDDGPSPEWTPKYLRLLAKYHVQATFCVIGEQVREYPKLVKAAVTEGHHIANHTYHHPLTLPSLSAKKIRSEMEDTNDAIVRATGFRPRQFRAPGGVWGPDVFAEVARQEMLPLGWDIDPRDWALPGVSHIRSAMLAARPHDIVLCHDGGGNRSETYAALTDVIPALLSRGWKFVTLPAPQTV